MVRRLDMLVKKQVSQARQLIIIIIIIRNFRTFRFDVVYDGVTEV